MPICTLPILGGKIYVVNSPEFAHAVIRNRSLNFEPLITDFIRRLADISDKAMEIYEDPAFSAPWMKVVYSSMTGESLRSLNATALKVVTGTLNELPSEGIVVPDLYVWARDLVTMASTTSLMGSKSPWRSDPRLINAYWCVSKIRFYHPFLTVEQEF